MARADRGEWEREDDDFEVFGVRVDGAETLIHLEFLQIVIIWLRKEVRGELLVEILMDKNFDKLNWISQKFQECNDREVYAHHIL